MLVKAKWNVKDASGWHSAGEVFQTENDLGDDVEVLEGKTEKPGAEAPEGTNAKEEVKAEKPKTSTRRRIAK